VINRRLFQKATSFVAAATVTAVAILLTQHTRALMLTARSVVLSDARAGESSAYTFEFTLQSASGVGSIQFDFCSNSPIHELSCTAPAGLNASSAAITAQTGETGFSVHANSDANTLILTRVPAAPAVMNVSYRFSPITNPSTAYQTTYVRITTYSTDDASGVSVDEGAVAYVPNEDITVSSRVPPYLELCTAISIPNNNCNILNGNKAFFGTLLSSTTKTATSQMFVRTNAANGYALTANGNTMTSGNNTIDNLTAPAASHTGTNQFGINLRDNAAPNVGSNPSGPGTGTPTANYNIADQFTFKRGAVVARSVLPTNYNKYTASYIVNVSDDAKGGVYTTTVSYVATASF